MDKTRNGRRDSKGGFIVDVAKADRSKLFYDFNIREWDILIARDWLKDIIIDSAMNLLLYQFPHLSGFQSCHLINYNIGFL